MSRVLRVLAAGALALATAACGRFSLFGGGGGNPNPDVYVLVHMKNGACVIDEPLQLRQKSQQPITWHVKNQDCAVPAGAAGYRVRFENFARKDPATGQTNSAEPTGSVVDHDPESKALKPGDPDDVHGKIVRNVSAITTYKYEIWMDDGSGGALTMRRDPDLEIWP